MFPEAGGSSSFARHAFNDWISFFAGWALSLDYILTIAISAYFVPFYASALPGLHAIGHPPGNIIAALVALAVLVVLNIRGLGESAKVNFILAVTDLGTQVLVVILGVDPRAEPVAAGQPGAPRHRAEPLAADLRAVDRDARLHRHRDRLEHGRGGPGPRQRRAQGRQPRAVRGARRLHGHLGRRALGAARRPHRRPRLHDAARQQRAARLRVRAGARDRRPPRPLGHPAPRRAVLRRPAGHDDPLHRDQRRPDRHLAPVVVAVGAPPAAGRSSRGCTRPIARRGSRSSSSPASRCC